VLLLKRNWQAIHRATVFHFPLCMAGAS